jgi:hypothetical protein
MTATPLPDTSASAPAVPAAQPSVRFSALRAGSAVVESVVSEAALSASAGSSAPTSAAPPYRVTLQMEDGSRQDFRDNSLRFRAGDRLRVREDGALERQ